MVGVLIDWVITSIGRRPEKSPVYREKLRYAPLPIDISNEYETFRWFRSSGGGDARGFSQALASRCLLLCHTEGVITILSQLYERGVHCM